MKDGNDLFLKHGLDVDEEIAAGDHIHLRKRRIIRQVLLGKDAHIAHRLDQYQRTIAVLLRNAHTFAMKSLGETIGSKAHLSVVDDDVSMRESLPDLIGTFGFAARAFASAEEFLMSGSVKETICLILDIGMPGMSGPDLQQELKRRGDEIPIIFITGQRDEIIRARVLEQGASGFLIKPFSDAALLAAIKGALRSEEPPANPSGIQ